MRNHISSLDQCVSSSCWPKLHFGMFSLDPISCVFLPHEQCSYSHQADCKKVIVTDVQLHCTKYDPLEAISHSWRKESLR